MGSLQAGQSKLSSSRIEPSKHQSIINLPQLLLPKSEVSAGDGGA